VSDILRISVPLTVWLASFSAIYGLHGLACAGEWAAIPGVGFPLARTALVLASIVAVALQLGLFLALRSDRYGSPSPFVCWTSVTLAATALVATLWTLFPVVATSTCL
jgi:hypothetical protein